jgi:hypothetical protein
MKRPDAQIIAAHAKLIQPLPKADTFPKVIARNLGKRVIRHKNLISLVIQYERRKRWMILRAELGPEYLEKISRQSNFWVDAA